MKEKLIMGRSIEDFIGEKEDTLLENKSLNKNRRGCPGCFGLSYYHRFRTGDYRCRTCGSIWKVDNAGCVHIEHDGKGMMSNAVEKV